MKLGDIVYLNSGSPPLTITQAREDGYVEVEWSGTDGELRRHAFLPVCLTTERVDDWPPSQPVVLVSFGG